MNCTVFVGGLEELCYVEEEGERDDWAEIHGHADLEGAAVVRGLAVVQRVVHRYVSGNKASLISLRNFKSSASCKAPKGPS